MAGDVFKEDLPGLHFADDARDFGPEMPRIFFGEPLTGARERLAGITGSEDIHPAAPRFAAEAAKIAPNRRSVERSVFKTRNQLFGRSDFPFHVQDRASFRDCEPQSEIDPADSGA